MLHARRPLARRLLIPALIVLVAAGFHLWSRGRGARGAQDLVPIVATWCEAAARGEDLAARLPVAHAVIAEPLARALTETCGGAARSGGWTVLIEPGDGPDFDDAGVTHHALIGPAGTPRLGIRIVHGDGTVTIAGYWTIADAPAGPTREP